MAKTSRMQWLVIFTTAFLLTTTSPALAWLETLPGDLEWPEIPGQAGIAAFLDTWTPQSDNGGYQNAGDMTLHNDGRITFAHAKEWKWQYRVVEATPYYVVMLVRQSGSYISFWAFRPLGKWFRPRNSTDMNVIAASECDIYGDEPRKKAIWASSDEELAAFWKSNKFCHPDLAEKTKYNPYWGERWGQVCYFAR